MGMLLTMQAVFVQAPRRRGRMVAGCIINTNADVAGISNVFVRAAENRLVCKISLVGGVHRALPRLSLVCLLGGVNRRTRHGFYRLLPHWTSSCLGACLIEPVDSDMTKLIFSFRGEIARPDTMDMDFLIASSLSSKK